MVEGEDVMALNSRGFVERRLYPFSGFFTTISVETYLGLNPASHSSSKLEHRAGPSVPLDEECHLRAPTEVAGSAILISYFNFMS